MRIRVENGAEAVEKCGEPRLALKKGLIQKREPKEAIEVVTTSWGPQEAHRGVDFVAIQSDGAEYPYKVELFNTNMEEHPEKPGYFRKATPSKLIEVPNDVVIECVTIDGGTQKPLDIAAPNFLCIGAANEVYPLSRETFDRDFDWA